MTGQLLTGSHFLAERGRRAVGLVALLSVMSSPQLPVAAPKTQESIVPLPFTVDQDPAKVALGKRLFHDVRLSRDNSMSCTTCHQLERGGDDALPRSKTATGNLLHRNAPTVFNVALNPFFNWDGGVPSLEVQAERVLLNPKVMNNTKSLPEQARQAQHGRWKALRPMALGYSSVPAHHPGRVRGDDGVISRGEP
jgi:cytochrome c peroxidase